MSKNYTTNEVAKELRVNKRTILREIKRGNLRVKKVGRKYLITETALRDYLVRDSKEDLIGDIDRFLDSKEDAMVTMLQRLVAIPSESKKSHYDVLAKYIKTRLDQFGIRSVNYGKEESVTVRGTTGYAVNGILFDCPLDTAPVGDREKWKHPPFDGAIVGGKMFGRGTVDCKGGMVAMMFATHALSKFADNKKFRVELVFDGGEHSGAYDGMREVLRRGFKVDAGVVGYGGTGNNIALGCRGYHRYKIVSKGHSVHSGARFKAGVNAITNMAVLINEMEHVRFPKDNNKYFNFGSKLSFTMIEGGKAVNIIPDECFAYLDVRTTPNIKKKYINKTIQDMIDSAKHRYKGFNITKEYLIGQEGYVVKEDEKFVSALSGAVTQVKRKKPGLIVHGPSHIGTIMAIHDIPVVVWGPDGGNIHSYNEYIELDSLVKSAKVYARSVLDYFDVLSP